MTDRTKAIQAIALTLAAVALSALASGCASTHQYYSASSYQTYRIGNGTAHGNVRVSATTGGITVTPTVRYHLPAKHR